MEIKALLLDIGGVLYEGDKPIDGAIEAIDKLKKKYKIKLLTNTTQRAPQTIIERLKKMGFNIEEKELFSALAATKEFLKKENKKAYGVVTNDAYNYLAPYLSNNEDVDYVVIGDAAENFKYQNLNRAFRRLMDGAKLIAIAKNRYFKDKDNKLSLDAGAFVKALEYASQKEAKIIGKPSKEFFNLALKSLGYKNSEVVMVGDDIESDILGAQNAGIKAILVKSGKFKPSDLDKPIWPDGIIKDITKLYDFLEEVKEKW